MLRFRITLRTTPPSTRSRALIPIFALVATLVVTLLFIRVAAVDPGGVFYHMLVSPFASRLGILEIPAKATPLVLTGLSVLVAFTAGFNNIGAEGQLYAGALAATCVSLVLGDLPPLALLPTVILCGAAAGACWSGISAELKVRRGMDEVFTTLILTWVMIFLVTGLLNGPLQDPQYHGAQSETLSPNAYYPLLAKRSRLHLGSVVALVLTIMVAVFLKKSATGFEMRVVGANPRFALTKGIDVNRTIVRAALLSGGLAGIAGVGEVLGIHHCLIATLSPGYGFTGIAVAKLSGLNPWLTVAAAMFIAVLGVGAQFTNLKLGIPIQLAGIVQWTLLLSTLAGVSLTRYTIRRA